MLLLQGHATTPDELEIVTGSAANIDVYGSHVDSSDAAPPVPENPEPFHALITTATTTVVATAPTSASKVRNIKALNIRNRDAAVACQVTVQIDRNSVGSDVVEQHSVILAPGEVLELGEGFGWYELAAADVSEFFIRAAADRTLPNDTNLNAIFNSPANGRLTLPTGVYIFDGLLIVTAMSATSGNALINIIGAGTATVANWMWQLHGLDGSTPSTIADDDAAFFQTNATAASAVAAGTGTALRMKFEGTFEVTAAGTLIPSIDQVTAAAAVVESGSHFRCRRIGDVGMVSVGPWD